MAIGTGSPCREGRTNELIGVIKAAAPQGLVLATPPRKGVRGGKLRAVCIATPKEDGRVRACVLEGPGLACCCLSLRLMKTEQVVQTLAERSQGPRRVGRLEEVRAKECRER
jgi:hypothetical protein